MSAPRRRASTERLQALGERALAAGVHRRVAQRVRGGLRLAQLLDEIEEVGRLLRLEGDDELLIVEAERVGRVQLNGAVLRADAYVLVHHLLALLDGQPVPLARLHERIDEE